MSVLDETVAAYDRDAIAFAARYEGVDADSLWGPIRDMLPPGPGRLALDVGAGSGRDAAWLAGLGFETVAAEPAAGMRSEGTRRHPRLRWVDDRLPALASVHRLGLSYDLVLLSAVWMHLPSGERPRAFRKLATLLKPGGVLVVTLRRGPVEPGRGMYPTSLGEIEALAREHGLSKATPNQVWILVNVGGRPSCWRQGFAGHRRSRAEPMGSGPDLGATPSVNRRIDVQPG